MELTAITPSTTALKALTHPVRVRMLGLLRAEGPATATSLAARLGLNTGATSYHLRQLASHGFVEEDAERGNGRDRWWRAAHQATHLPDTPPDEESRETYAAYLQAVAMVHTERLQAAVEERTLLPEPWLAASTFSDWGIRLTPDRAEELVRAVVAVIGGWEELPEDAPGAGDATDFVIQLNAFPRPGTVTTTYDEVP